MPNAVKKQPELSRTYRVRPFFVDSGFEVNDRRYLQNAHVLLAELEDIVVRVNRDWPKELGEAITPKDTTPEHSRLARRRDLVSDSVKLFATMSVEAFVNFYGVYRLGEDYDDSLEKRGLLSKVKALLQICDQVPVADSDPIARLTVRVAKRRSVLVHPKTKEIPSGTIREKGNGDPIPGGAREAVSDAVAFFVELGRMVPKAKHQLPPPFDPKDL